MFEKMFLNFPKNILSLKKINFKKFINAKMLNVFLEIPGFGIPSSVELRSMLGVEEIVLKLRRNIKIIHENVLYRSWFIVFERN